MLDRLTEKQRSVFQFIRNLIQTRGYGPTVREIGEYFGIASPNGVMCHLRALEKKGLIRRWPGKSRAIELLVDPVHEEPGNMPFAGDVAAGSLNLAEEQDQKINLSSMFVKPNRFALRVSGESMIEAHIAPGDYVIIDPSKSAQKGDIVVARTPEGSATLKYWFPENGQVRLQPANSEMKPIFVSDVQAIGVVVGVVRQL